MTGTPLLDPHPTPSAAEPCNAQQGLLAMCINPRELWLRPRSWSESRRFAGQGGLRMEVPCRRCWQCRTSRVWDWVGKSIAESKTAKSCSFVTLTYGDGKWVKDPKGPDHWRELHYADVQKWMKRIRIAGYPVRYVIAGEYGELKGRAHWHALLFWQDREPNHPIGNEWQDQFWPHGHVNWQEFSVEKARYVCKYLLKYDHEESRKTEFHFSARPGIGFEWLKQRAWQHVEQGLAPRDPWYYFPEVRGKEGPRQFYLSPAAQMTLVRLFEEMWYARYASHPPTTPFTDRINDLAANPGVLDVLHQRGFRHLPEVKPPNGEPVCYDQRLNAFYFDCGGFGALRFYWSFDERGERSWERELVTEAEARKRRAGLDTPERHMTASGSTEARRAAGPRTL